MKTADQILDEGAATFRERNAIYGDNFRLVGPIMETLFPGGAHLETAEDHTRYHILVLQIVKITRYAQNWRKGGHHDSMVDLSVYAAMLAQIDGELGGESIEGDAGGKDIGSVRLASISLGDFLMLGPSWKEKGFADSVRVVLGEARALGIARKDGSVVLLSEISGGGAIEDAQIRKPLW